MAVRILAESTWEEVRDLERARTVAILPVGATEAHGPHLPLGTDVLICRGMAEAGAERMSARGLEALILPPLAYTPAGFAAGFPGTVSVSPGALAALLTGVAASLDRHGFGWLAVANAHLDPDHLAALHDGTVAIERDTSVRVAFPDLTRRPWATRLGEEFRSGACHAGRYEGSLVLALRPDLVRDDVREGLAPNPASLSRAIGEGLRTFEEAGGSDAYFGWPADASAEEGERHLRTLGEILDEAVQTARREAGE